MLQCCATANIPRVSPAILRRRTGPNINTGSTGGRHGSGHANRYRELRRTRERPLRDRGNAADGLRSQEDVRLGDPARAARRPSPTGSPTSPPRRTRCGRRACACSTTPRAAAPRTRRSTSCTRRTPAECWSSSSSRPRTRTDGRGTTPSRRTVRTSGGVHHEAHFGYHPHRRPTVKILRSNLRYPKHHRVSPPDSPDNVAIGGQQ